MGNYFRLSDFEKDISLPNSFFTLSKCLQENVPSFSSTDTTIVVFSLKTYFWKKHEVLSS